MAANVAVAATGRKGVNVAVELLGTEDWEMYCGFEGNIDDNALHPLNARLVASNNSSIRWKMVDDFDIGLLSCLIGFIYG